MQVDLENVNSVKKILHIEIPPEDVAEALNEAYRELKKTAKIKGFRPGKAPRNVLERLYKKEVHSDVSQKLIRDSLPDAIDQAALQIVGYPRIDPPELEAEGPYRFDATVEVKPEIGDIDFTGMQLVKTLYRPTEAEIDAQIQRLRMNAADYETVRQDRPVEEGDFVAIEFEGLLDGQPVEDIGKSENFIMEIGIGRIHPDLDRGIVGMQVGETREIPVRFPEDYQNQRLAGREVIFATALNEIRTRVLPPIDDNLAKTVGAFETLAELKERIETELKKGYDKRMEQEIQEQIYNRLIGQTDFEVPETLVEMELNHIIQDAESRFAQKDMKLEDVGMSRESLAEKYRDTALKLVKRHLILQRLIEQEQLLLTDTELNAEYEKIAENIGRNLDEVRAYYQGDRDSLNFLRQTLLEKKAVTLIIDNATMETREPELETDSNGASEIPRETDQNEL